VLGSVVEGASPQANTQALSEQVGSILWNKLQAQESTHQPIIFVCHSLGGLLIKRVLVNAWQRGAQPQGCEFDQHAVKAILFCGTPHKGAGLADILGHFANGKRLLAKYAPMLFGAEEFSSNAIQVAAAAVLEPSVLIEELRKVCTTPAAA
jgi:triacylglycerol esterase/lipase EstA (alpha/beta hydrolase family)